jgi:hypothetical protein
VQKCSLAALCSRSGAFPIQGPVVIGISSKLVGVAGMNLRPLVLKEGLSWCDFMGKTWARSKSLFS